MALKIQLSFMQSEKESLKIELQLCHVRFLLGLFSFSFIGSVFVWDFPLVLYFN